jgi:outer membrane protein TolC
MKNSTLLLFILLFTYGAKSQVLNLEQCLKMSDTANVVIRNARLDVAMSVSQIDAYKSALLPKIFYAGDYRYNAVIPGQLIPGQIAGGAPGTYVAVQFGVPVNISNTVQLNQVLFNPQLNAAIKTLKINQEVSEIQAGLTEQNVKYQLIQTYYNLQAIHKQLTFVQENCTNMDKMIANMKALVEQKMVIATELDKLNITRLTLKNQEQTLISTKEKTENYLKLMIGKTINDKVEFQQEGAVQRSILNEIKTINAREIQLLQAQQRLNIVEKKGISMAYLPVLSMYGTYLYSYNYRPENSFGKGINGAFVGLKLDWTLFDGFEKYHKSKVNVFQRAKIEDQLDYSKKQLDVNIINAQKQVEIQTQSLQISQDQLVLAEKIQKQGRFSFEQGVISSNDLLKSENDLYQAQTNVVVAYVQLRQAELEVLKLTGNIK